MSLIHVKRDNTRPLTDAEISWLFAAYLHGEVADEQMAALLMAIFFNGLDADELRAWTTEMIASGETLDLSNLKKPTVDKHSTGGVSDKVSLVLAPLVASCGAAVPPTVRPGPRAHRRHARQAGVDPRLGARASATRS